jgi:carboxypeptidase-like protein
MKFIILFIVLNFITIFNIKAQTFNSITGKIIDGYSEKELENVIITLQNSSLITSSKSDGIFSIKNISKGEIVLKLSLEGFEILKIPINISGNNEKIDLGIIRLTEKTKEELDNSIISLTDDDLYENEIGESNTISGLLIASKDVFFKTVAYEFSPTFFKPRNLGSEYMTVLLNGINMKKIFNGRPQWSNWGGINDVLRNQLFTANVSPSNNSFGNIAGTTDILTRSSNYRKGAKISYASSNRSYKGRVMATYSSGLLQSGWAYTLSASRRYADTGFKEGTLYDANSFFASIDKKINKKHIINLTAIYASNTRGKASPFTQEVYNLKNLKYNAYWGNQVGETRNSRVRKIVEPIIQLSFHWKINSGTSVQTSATYQFGKVGNSRLDYGGTRIVIDGEDNQRIIGGGSNPDPTYYQKLPSYFLRDPNNPDFAKAYLAEKEFLKNGQIKWEDLYAANQNNRFNDGNSIYALYEDRNDDKQLSLNSILYKKINKNFTINAGIGYVKMSSENFANMLDLLGGNGYLDVDVYADNSSEAQSDLQNPNRIIKVNERFKYNFIFDASILDGFVQAQYFIKKLDVFFALNFSQTSYQREGLFENGSFPGRASLGKSEILNFSNYGIKGGLTYKYSGRHIFKLHAAYLTKAPTLQNSFSNARENNDRVIGLTDEKITSMDLSYYLRHPKIIAKISGYWITLKDQTDISFYFADGLTGLNIGESTAFVQEVLSGISKQNYGLEIGAEVPILTNFKLKAVAAVGQSVYAENPSLYLTSDDFSVPIELGKVSLKNYFVSGGPQQAYSFGFEYSSPNYWWFGSTVNYFNNAYISIAPITRTKNFYLDSDGLPINNIDKKIARELLRQEKLDPYFLVNIVGGKSWKIKNNYIGFFANVSNILNTNYKTGGFEQSRNANYNTLLEDRLRDKPLFGPKYWLGYGTSYYASVYFRF